MSARRDEDDAAIEALRRATENWTPEAKAKAAIEIRRRNGVKRQNWYCDRRPRMGADGQLIGCDGLPHEGYPYAHARAKQWSPQNDLDWLLWLVISGRGFGKTRMAAEWMRAVSNHVGRIAMVGRRGTDVRATMVEGEGGLINVCELAGIGYEWEPSKKKFTFANGAAIYGYSAEEPDSLRGPQHGAAWLDEPCHFDLLEDVWDNLMFGLRLPGLPGGAKVLATSTPLPLDWLDERIAEDTTRLTTGSTYENLANLDPAFKKVVLSKYEGTRTGQQELYGEIIRTVIGALWNAEMLQPLALNASRTDYERVGVAIDPAGSANKRSDETGIIAAGKRSELAFEVLADRSGKMSPHGWATAALDLYEETHADFIVVEKNFGGDMVRANLETVMKERKMDCRILVRNASQGKKVRAEPIAAKYEQKKVWHHRGLEKLEKEQTTWVPGKGDSPNRVDALVWVLTELTGDSHEGQIARPAQTRPDGTPWRRSSRPYTGLSRRNSRP